MPLLARSSRAVAALTRPARRFGFALLMLALAACSSGLAPSPQSVVPTRPQPTPTPRSAPPTLADAQAIILRAAAATELRWEQSYGSDGTDYITFTLTLSDTGFSGEFQVQDDGVRYPTRPLDSPSEAVGTFLLAVAAAPIREGERDFGTQSLDYYPRVSFELTTPTDTLFFDCTSLPAECVTWNVWIIPGRRLGRRFPTIPRQTSAHFLSTDVDLRVSLERLLHDLGLDPIRDQMFPRRAYR